MKLIAIAACIAVAACGDGESGGGVDAAVFDAQSPPDADIVACTADYPERAEPDNDLSLGGAAEDSELTLATDGTAVTMCGQLDPDQAGDETADVDFFLFRIDEDARVRVELRVADAAMATDIELALWLTNDAGTVVALVTEGGFRGSHGVVEIGTLAPGPYAVSVSAGLPAPDAPVIYTLDVLEDPDDCSGSATIEFDEAGDGSGSRGNDAVAIEFSPAAVYSSAGGTPEATAIALDPTAVAELSGASADVSPDGDDYRDRDSFEIATDAVTDELEVTLDWSAPADLDLFVFAAEPGDELTAGAGSLVGATGVERATIAVDPASTYWLWVGGIDGSDGLPAAYTLKVCGRQFAP